ncbi:uncharacterized protein [Clytia hemisphaerica]
MAHTKGSMSIKILISLAMMSFLLQKTNGEISCKDTLFTENEDDFESPNIPRDSKETVDCVYDIKLAMKSRWIKLSWQRFDIVGTIPSCDEAEHVEIYTGCDDRYLVARFCSSNMATLPHEIYSKERCMRIKYHSSPYPGRKRGTGFKAIYESYSESFSPFIKACQPDAEILRASSGIIASPGWPNKYEKKSFVNDKCEWFIQSSNREQMIQINFFDITLTNIDYLKREDEVELQGKLSSLSNRLTPFKRIYKGSYPPFTENTESHLVNATITIDSSDTTSWSNYVRNNGGFAFGYVIYDPRKGLTAQTHTDVPIHTKSETTKSLIKSPVTKPPFTVASPTSFMVTATISSENKNTTDNSIWDKIPWKIIAYVVLALIGTVVFALLTGAGAKKVCNCNFSINLSSPKEQRNKGYQSFDQSHNKQGARSQASLQTNQEDNLEIQSQLPFAPNDYPSSSVPSAPILGDGYSSPLPDYAPPSYQELVRDEQQNEKVSLL